jgi:predicted RNase H-like nuclease (RuvC/YqgF family)
MSADIRWLGPYAPTDRHADDVTLAHIVELRKKVEELQRHVSNLESYLTPVRKRVEKLEEALEVAIEILDDSSTEGAANILYAVLTEEN